MAKKIAKQTLQLGRTVPAPETPAKAQLDVVPNPHPDVDYVARTPVAVTGLTAVSEIANFEGGGYALRADGTVWAWGDNMYKGLGNDSVWDFSTTPVAVPGQSGLSTIGSGANTGYVVVANP